MANRHRIGTNTGKMVNPFWNSNPPLPEEQKVIPPPPQTLYIAPPPVQNTKESFMSKHFDVNMEFILNALISGFILYMIIYIFVKIGNISKTIKKIQKKLELRF